MKKLLVLAFAIMPLFAFAQESGIGLRFGEPFSITYKTYLDDRISIEGMIGRAGPNSGQYYRRSFENNRPSSNAFYLSHSTSNSWSLNLRGAYHEDFSDDLNIGTGYLLGYAGVGAQLRSVKVDYAFTDTSISQSTLRETRTNLDFGPEAFGGAEYFFDEAPISVFGEVGMFMELLDRFGHVRLQGGIGVRYIF